MLGFHNNPLNCCSWICLQFSCGKRSEAVCVDSFYLLRVACVSGSSRKFWFPEFNFGSCWSSSKTLLTPSSHHCMQAVELWLHVFHIVHLVHETSPQYVRWSDSTVYNLKVNLDFGPALKSCGPQNRQSMSSMSSQSATSTGSHYDTVVNFFGHPVFWSLYFTKLNSFCLWSSKIFFCMWTHQFSRGNARCA